jgi:hypothetical protein
MRSRLIPAAAALALLLGLLTGAPAAASVPAVESITFPGGFSEFYSPFSGPATIRFTFDGSENDATFNFRIRPAGGAVIHTKEAVFVDADDPDGFVDEPFTWPALSVNSARTYVVAVYKSGVKLASESFSLRPRLATITRATPNPFLPWIDDGYKDTTDVRFTLLEDADAEARVFRANGAGKCCGDRIRTDDLGHLTAGVNHWTWDGEGDGPYAGNRPKGNYFVKIWSDDGIVAPALSKPFTVTIARTYRAKATRSKPARNYHHRSASTPIVIGGGCFVMVENGDLRILCQGGRVSVYWRWGLSGSQRIEKASFVLDTEQGSCPSSIRQPGHTQYESRLTVNEDLVEAGGDCYFVTAKITYSYPKPS